MTEYHKIPNVYRRDMDGSKKLIEGEFLDPVVEALQNIEWIGTEKIDGTNIRVIWDGHRVEIKGRTDRADIPKFLYETLEDIFLGEDAEMVFEELFGEKHATLYGEGYGNKIQKVGKLYREDTAFRLFDVHFPQTGSWLPQDALEGIANAFGTNASPIVFRGSVSEAVEFVKTHEHSTIEGTAPMEGIVIRPKVELRNNSNRRIVVKIKRRDFE